MLEATIHEIAGKLNGTEKRQRSGFISVVVA
jgi:hypothetical protein